MRASQLCRSFVVALSAALVLLSNAHADKAHVRDARIEKTGDRTYTITVTVEHGDDGWDHYADAWEVIGPDGELISRRVLTHPHVNEQPFTRSKSGIRIAETVTEVRIRARDLEHGYGGDEITLQVPD